MEKNPGIGKQIYSDPDFNQNGWGKKLTNFFSRNAQSITLIVILALIIGGGIYIWQQRIKSTVLPAPEETAEIQESIPSEITPGPKTAPTQESSTEGILGGPEIKETSEGKVYAVRAQTGEGITHLARQTLKEYLLANPEKAQNLSKEHKIFIEDYLKDSIGSRPLEIGEEISFNENKISEAIEASLNLSQSQLKNLEQYSRLVTSL